jgi:uncharacterized protein (DUF362 family)
MNPHEISKVFLTNASDRIKGIQTLFHQFDSNQFSDCTIAMKANYNSADPFPATTHLDTLRTLVQLLKEHGSRKITLAERSGMGITSKVLDRMGILDLSKPLDFR